MRVQAWESSTITWHNVKIVKDHQSGVRTKISLEYTPTPPPVASPTVITSNPTASPITPTLMPTQAPAAPTQAPTISPIGQGYEAYRIWATKDMTVRGWLWDVKDLELYSDLDYTYTKFNDGTPIDSGNAGQSWGPENAFDDSDGSVGCQHDSDQQRHRFDSHRGQT